MRYWAKKSGETITSVESYSHDLDVVNRGEITEADFNAFIASLPPPPPPVNWKAEWLAAATVAKKIDILAKRLGLE